MIRNSTPVNNYWIDNYMRRIGESGLRCYLIIIRKTVGWHKESANITIQDFCLLTGLSKNYVKKGLKELEEMGLVVRIRPKSRRASISYTPVIPDEWRLIFPNQYKAKRWKIGHHEGGEEL
jgi:phage replication O-like protein O